MDYWLPIIVLFGAFFFMLALGVPIVYAIGLSTLASISTQLDFNSALSVVSRCWQSHFLSCLATL